MKIMKAGSRPTKKASSDWFTGTVWQDPIVEAPGPARVRVLSVAFEPGGRAHSMAHAPTRPDIARGQRCWPCWPERSATKAYTNG